MLRHGKNVLVAATAKIHHNNLIPGHGRCELHDMGKRMGGLERRDDALDAGQELEGFKRLLVGCRDVADATGILVRS